MVPVHVYHTVRYTRTLCTYVLVLNAYTYMCTVHVYHGTCSTRVRMYHGTHVHVRVSWYLTMVLIPYRAGRAVLGWAYTANAGSFLLESRVHVYRLCTWRDSAAINLLTVRCRLVAQLHSPPPPLGIFFRLLDAECAETPAGALCRT
jgi:hypothetical protein